jgi:hypothetical protein
MKILVQMPITTFGGITTLVERSMYFNDRYIPLPGSWVTHPCLPIGNFGVAIVGHDARRVEDLENDLAIYDITLHMGYRDMSMTVDEWLAANLGWKIVAEPKVFFKNRNLLSPDEI